MIVPRDVEGEAFAQGAEAACEETRENWVFEQSITWIRQIWLFCGDSSKSGFFVRSRQKTGYFKEQLVKNGEDCGEGFYVCDYSRQVVDLGEFVRIRGRE